MSSPTVITIRVRYSYSCGSEKRIQTRYDTPNTNSDKWVYWNFTFTPENPGSYVIKARSTTVKNRVSETPVTLMINAQ